jgi:steroid 5-alpha reductase family enzyme
VTGSYLLLLILGAVLASAAMTVLWLIQVRLGDASHVDAAWAIGIACLATMYALLADGDVGHRVVAAVLASAWGWRLGLYLLFDRVLGKEEDGRYKALRSRWGPQANRKFFLLFQFQAVFVVFFSVPYLLISLDPSGLEALEWVGTGVWAVGNAGAITADRHLARWRANPANRGLTARTGLWAWSRHPNYFFEWVTWCGVALIATVAPWGWLAWIVPAALLFLLFRLTGIPATEAQALRGRVDYAEYQRTTSVFVPLPPRVGRRMSRSRPSSPPSSVGSHDG